MSTVRERIAYVRGLIRGAEWTNNGTVGRDVMEKMLDIFDAIADEIEQLEADQLDVEEYLEAIDADLGDLEDEVLGDFDDDDDDDDDDEAGAHFIEMQCPACRTTVYFEDDVLFDDEDDDIACPECGEVIYRTGRPDADDDESSLL